MKSFKVIIGCDNAAVELKEVVKEFLDKNRVPYEDMGCDSQEDPTVYPEIAFVKGPDVSSASEQRFRGYRQALENYRLPFKEQNVFKGDLKLDTGSELAKIYISDLKNRPKGIVISNDMMAIGFVEHCRESGVKIPEQISVVSFDNIVFSSLYDISLTTVSQHVREMSEHAARLMLKQLKNPQEKPERVILDPTLIVRRTTCPYVPEQDGE